jgi:outer membrane lipoprotein carrier protein
MLKRLLPILVLFTCVHSARGQSGALEQLEQFTSGLNSLQANFNQEIFAADGRLVETSSGRLVLVKPDFFRWDYTGEYPQQIVADGKRVWIYDIELEQVSIKVQSSAAADSPLSVLTRPETIDEQFKITELGSADGEALLELVPLDEQAEFNRIIVGLADNQMRSMILEDAFGQRTHISYLDLEVNGEVADGTFKLEFPDGVDIIGDIPED